MVNQYTLCRRADTHSLHCEDNFYATSRDGIFVGAVFDGCSGGRDSYLASKLLARALERKLAGSWMDTYETDPNPTIMSICLSTIFLLSKVGTELHLQPNEMESTFVFYCYNSLSRKLIVKFMGDGYLMYRKEGEVGMTVIEVDQDGAPDYPIHFMETPTGFIDHFLTIPSYEIDDVVDFTVATDGINQVQGKQTGESGEELTREHLINSLTCNTMMSKSKAMLERKMNLMQHVYNAVLKDDLTMIRIINTPEEETSKIVSNEALQSTETTDTRSLLSQGA